MSPLSSIRLVLAGAWSFCIERRRLLLAAAMTFLALRGVAVMLPVLLVVGSEYSRAANSPTIPSADRSLPIPGARHTTIQQLIDRIEEPPRGSSEDFVLLMSAGLTFLVGVLAFASSVIVAVTGAVGVRQALRLMRRHGRSAVELGFWLVVRSYLWVPVLPSALVASLPGLRAAWLLALIALSVFWLPRLVLAPVLLLEHGVAPRRATAESIRLTAGHWRTTFPPLFAMWATTSVVESELLPLVTPSGLAGFALSSVTSDVLGFFLMSGVVLVARSVLGQMEYQPAPPPAAEARHHGELWEPE